MRSRPIRHGSSLASMLVVLVACGGAEPMPAATTASAPGANGSSTAPMQAPEEPSTEKLTSDSVKETPAGATFKAPAGWTLKTAGARRMLEGPESDVHFAFVENKETGAEAAVAAAWKEIHPDFKRAIEFVADKPARHGWEQHRVFTYETSPNEKLAISAVARRNKDTWTIGLLEASDAGYERRGAEVRVIRDSLRPKGYERESFKGKTAHALDAPRMAEIAKFVERAREQLGVPGIAISLVQDGKVVYEAGFGMRELGRPTPVDADTLFMIASNTKALSTLLLAKLIDEGKFGWETPVSTVYPAFKLGNEETTRSARIKHLVCACTGLPRQDDEWQFEFAKATAGSSMALLGRMQPTTKFGETFQYSNMLAAAAGFVGGYAAYPKRELGAAYDEAMRTRVFQPLGMKNTTFDYPRALRGNHATPHGENFDGAQGIVDMRLNESIYPLRPAGAGWSSAHDLTRYVQMELARGTLPDGTRYVSEKNLMARREPQVAMAENVTYAMGLVTDTRFGIPLIHHGGSMYGFKSDMFWLPEHGVGGVFLANADAGWVAVKPYFRKLVELLFDGRPEADEDLAFAAKEYKALHEKERSRRVLPPAADAVAALAKHYVSPQLGELKVISKGNSVIFDIGEWKTAVATRKNDDGTTTFIGIDPGVDDEGAMEFLASEREGKRALIVREAQLEYVFLEK
ncbi:beta-lactamase family protein [Pendulispora rubella]|uniref:Beta-lactamase family protein n=1 Tax=Pendulispora rubella TaxID=2741070 RepID=A0ABZ2L1S5_9BACT